MVHTFSALDQYIAVDVNSGAVHLLDRVAFDLLRRMETGLDSASFDAAVRQLPGYCKDELHEAWGELKVLANDGLLFSEDDYIDPDAAALMQKDAPIKALCLHVSHDCNLRCKYCFAATGDFGTGRKVMDAETARRAIDFVVAHSGARRNIEIDFFGGEPLMAMDTVKQTVEYARSLEKEAGKHFRFTLTTNGVLLSDENIDYLNREMSNVVLSLDGRPEVNDAVRPAVSGAGSYAVIMPKYKKLVAGRGIKDYYLRGTFTRNNLDFAQDVMHMAKEGFRNVSVEPAVGDEHSPWAIREEDVPRVMAEYDALAQELCGRSDVNFFHFNVDLAQGPCVVKRVRGCGAGCEYVAVTPEGDIYPCHQFVGNAEYKLGTLSEGIERRDLSDQFAELNIYTRPACTRCWARFYCSGGCSASNLLANGDIKTPHETSCRLERKRLECAIALKAAAMTAGK